MNQKVHHVHFQNGVLVAESVDADAEEIAYITERAKAYGHVRHTFQGDVVCQGAHPESGMPDIWIIIAPRA